MKACIFALIALLASHLHAYAAELALKEGDCWMYSTPQGQESSFLVIRKIEVLPKLGEVVHVNVHGLTIRIKGKVLKDQVAYFPLSATSLRASLTKKVEKAIPDFDWKKYYQKWRDRYDKGQAGLSNRSIGELVREMVETVERDKKANQAL